MNSDEIKKKKIKIREKETVENKTIIAIRCSAYSYTDGCPDGLCCAYTVHLKK